METFWPVLSHPFTWGLGLGLLIAAFVLKSALSTRAHLNREIKRLKDEHDQLQQHLNTHLKITASGNDRLEKDLSSLKEQNENLRVNIAALQQRPGRAEARQLQILETAVARMREQAPGFAQAWELAVRTSHRGSRCGREWLYQAHPQSAPQLSFRRGEPGPAASVGKGAQSLNVFRLGCHGSANR